MGAVAVAGRTLRSGDTAEAAWPAGCTQLVTTLKEDAPEAERVIRAPHWRDPGKWSPSELSHRLSGLLRAVGERGTLGRAFSARLRRNARNPFSEATGITDAERASGLLRVVRIGLEDPAAAAQLAGLLRRSGIASSVHPVVAKTAGVIEPDIVDQMPSQRPGGWAFQAIHAEEALDLEPGSPRVVVAVVDTGVEVTHPEFAGKLADGYDFVHMTEGDPTLTGDVRDRDPLPIDDAGHGTHVAGVVGARGLKMVPGIAGGSRMLPVRVLGTMLEYGTRVGIGQIVDIDDGIKFAVDEGADVINLSLGINAEGPGIPHQRAVRYALLNNAVVVAAAGNDGTDRPVFPGAVPGVITVGAITEFSRVASFSSWGPFLDVVAPGTAIYSADLAGRYRYRSGTSHAAPFVAGVAALIVARARRQGITMREHAVRQIIRETSARSDRRRQDLWSGAGLLDARDAIMLTSLLIRNHLRRGGRPRLDDPVSNRQPASPADDRREWPQ